MNPKPLSPRALLSLTFSSYSSSFSSSSSPFRYSILISRFSATSDTTSHSHFSSRRREGDSRNVKVAVWWDFENCHLPAGANVFKVTSAITAALRVNGIKGPTQITAFGDVSQLSRANQSALSSTGINLTHIPNGGKNSADRSLIVDLMYWVSQNPPPAHLFLISSDKDFANILHRLRMNNYNILLASKDTASSVLCSAASIMWHWNTLVRGEDLTGRHFNQPPDGPYGSWYGHSKVPLEDPFPIVEQPKNSQGDDLSEACLETNVHPIPKAVLKQIHHILSLNPKGIPITELRSELFKSNVAIDNKFYGYKKFSRFLLAVPHVRLQSTSDGQFLIHSTKVRAPEPFEFSPCMSSGSFVNEGSQYLEESSKPNREDTTISGYGDGNSSLHSCSEIKVEDAPKDAEPPLPSVDKSVKVDVEQPPKLEQASAIGEKVVEVANAKETESFSVAREQNSVSYRGIFWKIRRIWLGTGDDCSKLKSTGVRSKPYISGDCSEEKGGNSLEEKKVEKSLKSLSQDSAPAQSVLCSSSSRAIGSTLEDNTAMSATTYNVTSAESPSLFTRICNWCIFWRNIPSSNKLGDQPTEVLEQIKSYPGKLDVFSKDSFWRDMEIFLDTQKGSFAILRSRTREEMAYNMQKEGPSLLRSLHESDVLKLVDILISDKKWVEQCPSEASPFKLNRPDSKSISPGDSHPPNGLSSIFSSTLSHSGRSSERNSDKRIQNISHIGVSSHTTQRRTSERSRSEILLDCRKLVQDVLKDYPEGYNLGSFRKLFVDCYGYHLDIQKLGYPKLVSLLEKMPGVKIESTYIKPSAKARKSSSLDAAVSVIQDCNVSHISANSDGELSVSSKDNESDSQWEELGPVDNSGSSSKLLKSVLRRRAREETHLQAYPGYESSLSDDEFSDSEVESLAMSRPDERANLGMNDKDSSLLQILDSWYSSKDVANMKDKSENTEGMVDCSLGGLQPTDLSGLDTKIDISLDNYGRRKGPKQKYSFVADPDGNKDKLIEGILGNLKKSGESGMQS
uniref:Uncharacterized protein LOC8268001 n=1 Tax=Rhizophora mucronata TaxID=61149 RepID=A0A2P2Q4G3_RHIMU